MENHYFECSCFSDEHMLKFSYDPEDKELYLSTFLRPRRWYSRIWYGIKYALGYTCKYGHFDCTIIAPDDLPRLKALIDRAASQ